MSKTHDPRTVSVALHVHTLYSPCAETKLEDIGEYCRRKGIDVIGITDHDTIAGAVALKKIIKGVRVIIGEEIKSKQGEIVGLFLKDEIKPEQDARDTCEQIKEQGGLVYIPHPFDIFKIHRLKKDALMRVLDLVDMIEVFNAKSLLPVSSNIAMRFAEQHGKIAAAGSDAHYLPAIDLCVNEIKDFSTPQEFLENFRDVHRLTSKVNSLRTWWVGIKNALSGESHSIKKKKVMP